MLRDPSVYGPLAPAALQNKQRYREPGYMLLNAQVQWTDASGHYRVTVYGDNLTNKKYLLTNGGQTLGDYATYSEPITYGVRLGYNF